MASFLEFLAVVAESLAVIFPPPFGDTLATLLWCAFGGAVLALVSLKRRRRTLGSAVKTLLEGEVHSEEKALFPEEISPKARVRKALVSTDRLLAKTEKEGRHAYFLPEDRVKKARYLLKASSDGFWSTFGSVAALYATLLTLYYLLPILFPEQFGSF